MLFLCTSLTQLDLSDFNATSALYMTDMFHYCLELKFINLSNFNAIKAISFDNRILVVQN